MSLSTLQLASTSALALLASSAVATRGPLNVLEDPVGLTQSVVLSEPAVVSQPAVMAQSIVRNQLLRSRDVICATPPAMSRTPVKHPLDADTDEFATSDRPALDLGWKTKRTTSDVLTDLLDVRGVQVVIDRHLWDRPDTLALRHELAIDSTFSLYGEAGIDRAVYLESRASTPGSAVSTRRERSMGMMAEVGASWKLTGELNVETGVHWMGPTRNARLLRTDAGWVSADPVTMRVSLVWRPQPI